MPTQHDLLKASLVQAAKQYGSQYEGSPAELYIVHRGLGSAAEQFKLGYVSNPIVGHEDYRGRLAIPYLRPPGGEHAVATIRFRCVAGRCVKGPAGRFLEPHEERHEGHPKYLGLPGHPPTLFNTSALIHPSSHVGLGEGELDIISSVVAGVPASGTPGASSWRDHFTPAFAGFEIVFSLGDGDQAGRQFNEMTCEQMQNAVPISFMEGYDVNRYIRDFGHEAYRNKLGV